MVPITAVKITPSIKLGISGKSGPALGIGAAFGTGFCLDPACHFIATNYHVAVTTQGHKVKREKIIQRYLATGPRHRHHSADKTQTYVTGCTQSIQDGINLTDEKDNQIYSIVTNSKSLKAGERITLKGVLVPRWSWKSDFSNAQRDQRLRNMRDSFRIQLQRCEPNIAKLKNNRDRGSSHLLAPPTVARGDRFESDAVARSFS